MSRSLRYNRFGIPRAIVIVLAPLFVFMAWIQSAVSQSNPDSFFDSNGPPLPFEAVARIGSSRFRHAGEVSALAFSPDNSWLASASTDWNDRTVRLWETATGREIWRAPVALPGTSANSRGGIVALSFSTDNRMLHVLDRQSFRSFLVHGGNEVVKHEVVPEAPVARNTASNLYPIAGLGIAPDGKSYVVISSGGRLSVFDAESGKARARAVHPLTQSSFLSIEFTPDGRKFVIDAPGDKPAIVFQTHNAERVAEIGFDGFRAAAAQITSTGELFAHVSGRGTPGRRLVFLNPETGIMVRSLEAPGQSSRFVLSPDSKMIVTSAGMHPQSDVLDATTGKPLFQLPTVRMVRRLVFSPDGRFLAGCGAVPGAIVVWDVDGRRLHRHTPDPLTFAGAAFSADGRTVIVSGPASIAIDWRTGNLVRRFADVSDWEQAGMHDPVLSPDQILIAATGRGGALRLADPATGKTLRILRGHRAMILPLFSADSQRLATHDRSDSIKVWAASTGAEIATFKIGDKTFVNHVAMSADGKVLAAQIRRTENQEIVFAVWDVDSEKKAPRFLQPVGDIGALALSPDGRIAVGAGRREIVRSMTEFAVTIWDAASGRIWHSLSKHSRRTDVGVGQFPFTPDGRWVVTGDGDGLLRIWEVFSGQEAHRFVGHQSIVVPNFSADGRYVVAASPEAPCLVWDVWGSALRIPRPDAAPAWAALNGTDAKAAFQAIRQLVAHPQMAMELIRKHFMDWPRNESTRIDKLLAELDAANFDVRERATEELLAMADRCEQRLMQASERGLIEVRQRAKSILERMKGPSQSRIVAGRVLSVLELIGNAESVRLLGELALAAPGSSLSSEAAESRDRLVKRGVK